jgi:hypothetical protein
MKGDEANGNYEIKDFLAYFSAKGLAAQLPREVYEYLQAFRGNRDVPVCPADNLYEVYGMWSEDLDDAVLQLARKVGCREPTTDTVKDQPPVKTVEDLIMLLYRWCQQNNDSLPHAST